MAVAPLITDLPIILFVLFVLSNFMQYRIIIGTFALVGAAYLIYLGFENLGFKIEKFRADDMGKDALKRGVIANFLNPNPYLFWLSVGGPTIFESLSIGIAVTTLFIVGFYTLLVGSKITIVLIVHRSKSMIKSNYFIYIIRVLGILLILFALIHVNDGLRLIGLL